MAEKKDKAATGELKAKAVKKPSAPKAEAKADQVAKKEVAPAPKQEKKGETAAASGKTITLMQTASPIGRQEYQRATLIGLGLNKIRRTRTVVDTPSVRGMIEKVKHLIKVIE